MKLSEKLVCNFYGTFLNWKVSFTHAWGAIDSCSRFFSFFDLSPRSGCILAGYTGLGVGATRFGAKVMLDLLSGEKQN